MHETMTALEWQLKDVPQRYALGIAVEPGSVWCDVCQRWWGPESVHASQMGEHT